jgi:hypothetical protein
VTHTTPEQQKAWDAYCAARYERDASKRRKQNGSEQ